MFAARRDRPLTRRNHGWWGAKRRSGRPRPYLSKLALIVALLAALASVSRTFAHDDPNDHDKRDRDDRQHAKQERQTRDDNGRPDGPGWRTIGHDPTNTRNQPFERTIGPENVSQLSTKWVATTAGDVSATPAVAKGAVYFGDFGGMLWKRTPRPVT